MIDPNKLCMYCYERKPSACRRDSVRFTCCDDCAQLQLTGMLKNDLDRLIEPDPLVKARGDRNFENRFRSKFLDKEKASALESVPTDPTQFEDAMSIDKAFADLTVALNANTAALLGSTPKAAKPAKAAAPAQDAVVAVAGTPAPTAPAAAAPATPAAAVKKVLPKELVDTFVELATKKSRDVQVGLLGKYGVANCSALREDQYAAFIADAKALITPAPVVVSPGSDLI